MLYINTVLVMIPASDALPLPLADSTAPARRLLDQLRERVRYLHYSIRTEEAYVHWVRAFVRFHGLRHPKEMGADEVRAFLSWLAVERRVSVVLTVTEVRTVLALLEGMHAVLAQLLYGTGMRITQALQLRTKDIDFERRVVVVRCGKGGKDRVVMLPSALAAPLKAQLQRAHGLWQADQRDGRSGVYMPDALERKYPRAGASWGWFWVFPQDRHSTCPRTGVVRRHHLYDQSFQRAFVRAVRSPLDTLQPA